MEFKEVEEIQGYNRYVLVYENGSVKNPEVVLELEDIRKLITCLHITSFETLSGYLKDWGIILKVDKPKREK